jgi:putative ATP-dependent endonuclease of the OLD family
MEDLLTKDVSPEVLRTFLATVASRDDYPQNLGYLSEGATDGQVVALAKEVLKS